MTNRARLAACVSVAALTSAYATVVSAQSAPASSVATNRKGAGPEEIIVTAQRRSEAQSKTPVSVTVISGAALAKAQITSQQDLRLASPGLSVRAAVNSNQLTYALRGQSLDPLTFTTPGVLPYINEVQIAGTAGASAFYDLRSVQVLKGPQGTLFGRSATGGAVLFTTAKPTDTVSGYLSASGGSYDYQKYEGALNLPLDKDRLDFRLAGIYQAREGFQENLFTNGGRDGGYERFGVRPSLTAKIGDYITNELVVDYFHSTGSSTVGVISGFVPFTGNGSPFIPIQALYSGTATPTERATGIGSVQAFLPPAYAAFVPAYYNAYFGAGTGHPATGVTQFLADQQARGPYEIDSDGANIYHSSNTVVTNKTTVDVAPNTQLVNIFGFENVELFNASDTDGTPYGITESGNRSEADPGGVHEQTHQISDEFQLNGKLLDNRLTYVTGFYYADLRDTSHVLSTFFDILLGRTNQQNDYIISNRTLAGYGQVTYKLNDKGLAVTGGVRYTSELVGKITLPTDAFRLANPIAPAGYSFDQSQTYDKISWTVGIQDQLNPNLLLYAVSRRAYKSGGFNGQVPPLNGNAQTGGDGYGAQMVTDAELGTKFSGNLFGMPARGSVALYYDWIRDSQRLAFALVGTNISALTVNVPKATTYGSEFEGQVSPTPWLTLGLSADYTHATFASEPVFVNTVSQVFDQVPDTPRFTGSIFADVTLPISDSLDATLHADGYRQSTSYTAPRSQNDNGAIIQPYNIADFRVGIEDTRRGWSLTANVKNAFNQVYYVGGLPTGEILQINTLIPGEPRMFTIEGRVKF